MNDAMIDLILAGAGITPGHPQYAAMRSALLRQGRALSETQGEDTRRFDLTFEQQQDEARRSNRLQRDKLEQDYRIAKLSARNQEEANAIDRWKAEKDYELDTQRVQIEQGRLNLDTELGRGRLDLERGAQGLDLLRTDVDLRSSIRDAFKLADWEAGVRSSGAAPAFLQALIKNASASVGSNAPTMTVRPGLPDQNSLQAVLGNLGVGQAASDQTNAAMSGAGVGATGTAAAPSNSATGAGKSAADPRTVAIQAIAKNFTPSGVEGWNTGDVAALRAIAALAAQGENKWANRFSQLDEDDQELVYGGMARLGINPERTRRNVDRWRPGQGSATAA